MAMRAVGACRVPTVAKPGVPTLTRTGKTETTSQSRGPAAQQGTRVTSGVRAEHPLERGGSGSSVIRPSPNKSNLPTLTLTLHGPDAFLNAVHGP